MTTDIDMSTLVQAQLSEMTHIREKVFNMEQMHLNIKNKYVSAPERTLYTTVDVQADFLQQV